MAILDLVSMEEAGVSFTQRGIMDSQQKRAKLAWKREGRFVSKSVIMANFAMVALLLVAVVVLAVILMQELREKQANKGGKVINNYNWYHKAK